MVSHDKLEDGNTNYSDESDTEMEGAVVADGSCNMQTSTVFVENSSNIQVGPHIQYHAPVTIKQYITVSGEGNNGNVSCTTGVKNKVDPLRDVGLQLNDINSERNEKGTFQESELPVKLNSPKKKWLWIVFAAILFSSCIVTVVIFFGSAMHSLPAKTSLKNTQIFIKEKSQNVREGTDIKWEAEIVTELPTKLTWYGPECKKIDQESSLSKCSTHTKNNGHNKVLTHLVIKNVTKQDMGLYKLKVETEDNQQWNHFTLIVRDYKFIQKDYVVICYVAQWAHQRTGFAKFTVEDIDPTLCTHLIYAFAHLNTSTNTVYSTDPSFDLEENNGTGSYRKMTSLKQKYPHLKVLLGVGGWHERDNNNYSIMAESRVRRWEFIKSVTKFLRDYDFDGLDMHWQYPTEQHGVPADRENFVNLLKELREEFNEQKKGWILTSPLGVLPLTIRRSYIISEISKYLDYMLTLCYAYHGYWDGHTGPNAPLYGLDKNDQLNINYSINSLIELGAPPEKLVLGLPLYGRNFLLIDAEENDKFGGLTAGHGFVGRYVKEMDTWGYNEICVELETVNWKKNWDNITHTPFISLGNRFMSYDDKKSISEKVEFAISKNLAGVSVWSLDQDDFHGHCAPEVSDEKEYQYPLMKTINQELYSASLQSSMPCED